MKGRSDVIVLGGGLAGLSLALQLRQQLPQASITVLEKRQHPVPEAAFKVGESTVEVAAHYFGEVLGLRDHIRDQQLPKLGLRFFFPSADNRRIEERLELGGTRYAECPSCQLDRGRLENFLGDQCRARGIQFLDQADIEQVKVGRRSQGHQVSFKIHGSVREMRSRWIVDASGRRAFLKRQLGLAKPSPHIANAVWFRFSKHIKIDDWFDSPSWGEGYGGTTSRWYSTNHLMGTGYWVWMIPLASGATSVGIVASEEHHSLSELNSFDKAMRWLDQHEPQCAEVVKEHRENLQDFRAIKHYSVECKQVFSAQRWGITGEAGFFHDPFYSPGSDFIAFANTFLTDLIQRDLTGKSILLRSMSYDRIFKRFYYGTAKIYEGQYSIFGNPRVMPVKILWDYLVYWSISGSLFMQGRICHHSVYVRNLSRILRLSRLNHFMQDFFRRWHESAEYATADGFIDISQLRLVRESNARLQDVLNDRALAKRFQQNIAQLETLAAEIVAESGLPATPPGRRWIPPTVARNAFESVFGVIRTNSRAQIDSNPTRPKRARQTRMPA